MNEKVCKCGDSQILVEAQNDGSSESAPQCVTCIDVSVICCSPDYVVLDRISSDLRIFSLHIQV